MAQALLITLIIILAGVLLLGVKIFFFKGRFPNIHIGSSKAMKSRGIGCANSQDREGRKTNKNKINVEQL